MEVSSVTAKETRDQFLRLLVTQLRNQDPLEPIKQENFLSQLAQFSTLEGIENLNDTMLQQTALQRDSLQTQQMVQAAELIGQTIRFLDQTGTDAETTLQGEVDAISLGPSAGITLRVGDKDVSLSEVVEIGRSQENSSTQNEADSQTEVNRIIDALLSS